MERFLENLGLVVGTKRVGFGRKWVGFGQKMGTVWASVKMVLGAVCSGKSVGLIFLFFSPPYFCCCSGGGGLMSFDFSPMCHMSKVYPQTM